MNPGSPCKSQKRLHPTSCSLEERGHCDTSVSNSIFCLNSEKIQSLNTNVALPVIQPLAILDLQFHKKHDKKITDPYDKKRVCLVQDYLMYIFFKSMFDLHALHAQ